MKKRKTRNMRALYTAARKAQDKRNALAFAKDSESRKARLWDVTRSQWKQRTTQNYCTTAHGIKLN